MLTLIGSIGLGADTVIRIRNINEASLKPSEWSGDMNDLNVVTNTFAILGVMLSVATIWMFWIFFKKVMLADDVAPWDKWGAVGTTGLAVVGVICFCQGLGQYQGNQINEVLKTAELKGELNGHDFTDVPDAYSACMFGGLFLLFVAFGLAAKINGLDKFKCGNKE